jgi:hypothetical protein
MTESTYDLDTAVGQVRLLISDVGGPDDQSFIFNDDEIGAFLTLKDADVHLAAASALRTIASNEVQVSKRIKFLDISTDGPAVAKALHELADKYEEQADEDFDFDIAVMDVDVFTRRQLRGLENG